VCVCNDAAGLKKWVAAWARERILKPQKDENRRWKQEEEQMSWWCEMGKRGDEKEQAKPSQREAEKVRPKYGQHGTWTRSFVRYV
jgi:hypothetical protein